MTDTSKVHAVNAEHEKLAANTIKPKCGIVMPISEIDGCSESHWEEVLAILTTAAGEAGFHADIVSNASDIGIIQSSIVTNLYENEIVICDVSCKNPNVMFEMGMRLAFDKPTIIVKDDKTGYSFDTSPVRHLEYPRDLHHFKLMNFKEELIKKLKSSYESSKNDSEYSPFLRHFNKLKVAKIESKEISSQEYIVKKIDNIYDKFSSLERRIVSYEKNFNIDKSINHPIHHFHTKLETAVISILLDRMVSQKEFERFRSDLMKNSKVFDFSWRRDGDCYLAMAIVSREEISELINYIHSKYDYVRSIDVS